MFNVLPAWSTGSSHHNHDAREAPHCFTYAQAAVRLGCWVDAVRIRANRGSREARRMGRTVYVSRSTSTGQRQRQARSAERGACTRQHRLRPATSADKTSGVV